MSGGAHRDGVTELFHAFLDARAEGREIDRDELLRAAGESAGELERRLQLYDSLQRMAGAVESAAPPAAPARLGRFAILGLIGEGGLGRVYLAHDPKLGREVALKVLEAGVGLEEERAWVLNEARALARLAHPGVVRVFEVDRADGRDCVVMEYLAGPSLSEVLHELRRMRASQAPEPAPASEVCALARELEPFTARVRCLERIARALAYCHDRGVLHRDVKPSNVLFGEDGAPRLIDFGLAHRPDADEESRTGVTERLVGTAAYVAPEQIELERVGTDPRTDQFSFGVVCYELLVLVNPFQRETRTLTLEAVTRAHPAPPRRVQPAVSRDLERIVLHCLERDPDDRYPALAAVADDLARALAHRPIALVQPSLARALRLWAARNARAVAGAGGALALVVTALLAQWLAVGWAQRRDIAARVDALASEIDGLGEPLPFRSAGDLLGQLVSVAARLDGELAGALLGRCGEDVRRSVVHYSERLARVLTEEAARCEREGTDFQHIAWREILTLERALCPGCPANAPFHARGRVTLATTLPCTRIALYQQVAAEPAGVRRLVPVLRAVPRVEAPVPGLYRAVAWGGAPERVLAELEFLQLSSWEEPRALELVPPRIDVRARAVPVARGALTYEDSHAALRFEVAVPSFAATPHVTRAAFDLFLAERGLPEPLGERSQGDAGLAWVPWRDAEEYAHWAGGRLPLARELLSAHSSRTLAIAPEEGLAYAEWVADVSTMHGFLSAHALPYGEWLERSGAGPLEPDQADLSHLIPAPSSYPLMGAGLGTTFRVVFSMEDRDAPDAPVPRILR